MSNIREDEDVNEVVRDTYYDVEIPDATKSWNKMQVRLGILRSRRIWTRRLKVTAAILVASLLINVLLNNNLPTTYAKMSSLFKEMREQVVSIFFENPNNETDTKGARTDPPKEDTTVPSTSASEIVTLEEAKEKLIFPPLIPTYIPERFHLEQVRIFKQDGLYTNVFLEYVNGDNDILQVSQHKIDKLSANLKTDIHKDSGEIKETTINGNSAVLVMLPDGHATLEWLTTDYLKVSISGEFTEEELTLIGNSLQ